MGVNLQQLQRLTVDIDAATLWYIYSCPNTIAHIDASSRPAIPSSSSRNSRNICNERQRDAIESHETAVVYHRSYLINILLGWNATIVKHMSNQMRSVHSDCGLFVAWRMH